MEGTLSPQNLGFRPGEDGATGSEGAGFVTGESAQS